MASGIGLDLVSGVELDAASAVGLDAASGVVLDAASGVGLDAPSATRGGRCPEPASGHQRLAAHGMIVVEAARCTPAVIAAALAELENVCLRVTITVVADPIHPLVLLQPLNVLAAVTAPCETCCQELQRQAEAHAVRAARAAVEVVPAHIPAQHQVAGSWREALIMAERCDVLAVAWAPRRLRDRRRLRRRRARSVTA